MRELEPRALSTDSDYDELLERIAEPRIVMLGAASHGTQEFYRERCKITKRLIEERGYLRRDGTAMEDVEFYAEQHGRLAANAESYYRMLLTDRGGAWRAPEQHMAETLANLVENLERRGEAPRVVVWAHNSHVGDARVTELGERGEVSLGQLARERWPGEVALVGFTSYAGTVAASSTWAGSAERMRVRPALDSSYEALFHDFEPSRFYLDLKRRETAADFGEERLERAIGVVYVPERERESHVFAADISGQFDAVIHIDEGRAVEPLDGVEGTSGESPIAS